MPRRQAPGPSENYYEAHPPAGALPRRDQHEGRGRFGPRSAPLGRSRFTSGAEGPAGTVRGYCMGTLATVTLRTRGATRRCRRREQKAHGASGAVVRGASRSRSGERQHAAPDTDPRSCCRRRLALAACATAFVKIAITDWRRLLVRPAATFAVHARRCVNRSLRGACDGPPRAALSRCCSRGRQVASHRNAGLRAARARVRRTPSPQFTAHRRCAPLRAPSLTRRRRSGWSVAAGTRSRSWRPPRRATRLARAPRP